MKKQKGFSLIGILLIIGALIITAGGVVVWRERISLAPSLMPTPTPVPQNQPTASPEKSTPCQTSADCLPVIGVCMPGKCPTYQCLNGRCVFFEDAMVLRSCLEEATLQECAERYGR